MPPPPLDVQLVNNIVKINNDLKISFRRTIRVPDTQKTSFLPPDLGTFPLKPVSTFADKLTAPMSAKGGLFFPMYREYSTYGLTLFAY